MIRITLLMLVVAYYSIYAWNNWFVSVCIAVLLLAVVEHPDFPNAIGGLQGANPWNVLILSILMAWAMRRRESGYEWDLPPIVGWMLCGFLAVIAVGVARLLGKAHLSGQTSGMILSEYFVNTVKWVMPSLLLFDACRTRRRIIIGLAVIIGIYLLLALQVIRWIPLSAITSGDRLSALAAKLTANEIGYNRVTLSMMLAGASWAALAAIPTLRKDLQRFSLLGVAGVIVFGQALTAGRTGYITWIAVGMVLAALRWPKLLLAIPVVLVTIGFAVPSARERMFQGFAGKEGNFSVGTSTYEMTSGRDLAWPRVIDGINNAPLIGYGRCGMVTSGISDLLINEYGESFPHPHQAYLELLLDNGIVGFLIIIPLYFYVLLRSVTYVLVRNDPLVCAVGCCTFCLVLALLVGAFGGQTFYPREGAVGMWAAIGLMLRVHVNSLHAAETDEPIFRDQLPAKWFVNALDGDGDWANAEDPLENT